MGNLLKNLPKQIGQWRRKQGIRGLSEENRDEWKLCSPHRPAPHDGFRRFCHLHVIIQDRVSGVEAPFVLFAGQERIIPFLVAGQWLICLKGRQLGLTWEIAAYCVWRIVFMRWFTIVVVFHEQKYAREFIRRIRWILERLPPWLRPRITTDNKDELHFHTAGHRAEIVTVVGSDKAGRSLTGDLLVLDEASRIPNLGDTLAASQPAFEVAGGQIILLTTSAGPEGDFAKLWTETYGVGGSALDADGVGPTGFRPVFLHWSERPGRTGSWYADRKRELDAISTVMVKREYPDTPEQAFEFAAGRIFPLFTRERSVGDIEIPDRCVRYRAIDWGQGESAQVYLWIAYIPGKPGLLVSPKCPNTIREMLGYRWDEDNIEHPVKEDDHSCDALRYAVTTFRLTGFVYVYREWFIPQSARHGWTPMKEIQQVHELSGWVRGETMDRREKWVRGRDGEAYKGTVADRRWSKIINEYTQNCIPTRPNKRFRRKIGDEKGTDPPLTEVIEGIAYVNMLIDASVEIERIMPITREQQAMEVLREDAAVPGITTTMDRRVVAHRARRLLLSRRRGRERR